jgi:hypothetical protein
MARKRGGYMGDPEITGEREINIGLRRRPLKGSFLKGPLPLDELVPAVRMPGKVLAVWLLIRYRTDLNRGNWATLPQRLLQEWGIGKNARADALRRLEQAGLIKVVRPKGYMLKVKLIRRRRRDDPRPRRREGREAV